MRSVLLSVVLLVLSVGAPAVAVAYTQPSGLTEHAAVCPPRPAEPAEGATATEVDLVTIAQEVADGCNRGEELASQQHTDAGAIHTRLGETLTTTISGEPTVTIGNWSSAPSSSTVELGTAALESLKGNSQAIHDDLWFLIASLIACVVALIVYLEVRPRR
jgi:hypothetical protein